MSLIPPNSRAVLFDAVGTLIHPDPSPTLIYAEAGRRHGSQLTPDVVATRYRAAFRREEEKDRTDGHRTDEARELARWQTIVREIFIDSTDVESCFRFLYDHFTRPENWRVEAGAGAVLQALAQRGLILGMVSNFDHRLRAVVAGLPELAPLRHLIISSEVGWRKPAAGFFAAACRTVACVPADVLIVGDDPDNDFHGAKAAGHPALLFNPRGPTGAAGTSQRLAELHV